MTTEPPAADPATPLPLAGVRIIDISNVFSLPYAGGLLADLGAEVIKIEGPARLDVSRGGNFSGVYPDNQIGDDPWSDSTQVPADTAVLGPSGVWNSGGAVVA